MRTDAEYEGRGLDIDPEAVETAKANAKRAGVNDCTCFETGDARSFVPLENEIILANPPYGERLMDEPEVERLYKDFGENIFQKNFKGLYIISSHPEFEHHIGKKATRRRKLYNGMLTCQLFMYF